MHALQPKHSRLNEKETEEILNHLNIAKSQLPKIFSDDPALPEDSVQGDVIKIERKDPEGNASVYYRVVV